MDLDSIDIDYTPRTEHPNANGMVRDWRTEQPTVVGYNAVYRMKGFWFSYHESGRSRVAGFATREEAEQDVRKQVAGNVSFWDEKVTWRTNGDRSDQGNRVVRAGGEHYVIRREPTDQEWESRRSGLGFGGGKMSFRILATGEVIKSRNVWTQGTIPVEFRELLPDNAERVTSDASGRVA